MQAKQLPGNISNNENTTNGQPNNFEEVDWEHLDQAVKNKPDNYNNGDLNKPPDSAVQDPRSAITQVTHTLTKDAQTADEKKWMST
jgi:hypothetical protein